jgi:hypothetical protein
MDRWLSAIPFPQSQIGMISFWLPAKWIGWVFQSMARPEDAIGILGVQMKIVGFFHRRVGKTIRNARTKLTTAHFSLGPLVPFSLPLTRAHLAHQRHRL